MSGDVDLNDGQLQSLYLEYKQQLKTTGEVDLEREAHSKL